MEKRIRIAASWASWPTKVTCKAGVYEEALKPFGLEVLIPALVQQNLIHKAIYRIKATSGNCPISHANRLRCIEHLRARGAQAIILGCTELPLAVSEERIDDLMVIDPTLILARALVREANPTETQAVCFITDRKRSFVTRRASSKVFLRLHAIKHAT